jgi:hypothetical protein
MEKRGLMLSGYFKAVSFQNLNTPIPNGVQLILWALLLIIQKKK